MNDVFCAYFNKELRDKLKEYAEKKGISQNAVLKLALSEFFERNK